MSRRNNNTPRNGSKSNKNNVNVSESSTGLISITPDQLMYDSANLNYSYLPGSPIMEDIGAITTQNRGSRWVSLPAVMRLNIMPTIGITKSNIDPINLAAAQIYKFQRSKNAGSKNYDTNNFMIYLMTMDSLYSFHAWMVRLYGVAGMYTSRNYNYPDMLVKAMGVDPSDLRTNSLKLKAYIQLYAKRVNTIAVPDVIPLIREHATMYASIYCDEKSVMGQNYLFNPYKLYHYVENATAGSAFGTLQTTDVIGGKDQNWTIADIINFGNTLIEDALHSEDLTIMSGDIQKAYESNVITLPTEFSDTYTTEIVYDEKVLTSIHNANVVKVDVSAIAADPTSDRITQTIKAVSWKDKPTPTYQLNMNDKRIIDQHTESPDVMDNLYATRFMVFTGHKEEVSNGTHYYEVVSCGPDIIVGLTVYGILSPNAGVKIIYGEEINTNYLSTINQGGFESPDSKDDTDYIYPVTNFKMAPFLYAWNNNYSNYNPAAEDPSVYDSKWHSGFYLIGDLYNPTVIDVQTHKNMMVAYFMRLFNV